MFETVEQNESSRTKYQPAAPKTNVFCELIRTKRSTKVFYFLADADIADIKKHLFSTRFTDDFSTKFINFVTSNDL